MGERLKDAAAQQNSTFTLFCPAQSYPVPTFRYNSYKSLAPSTFRQFSKIYNLFATFLEPVGSVAPKISVENRLKNAEAQLGSSFTLFCPG